MTGSVSVYFRITVPGKKKPLVTFYQVNLERPCPSMMAAAWRLVKPNKDNYVVSLDNHGHYHCTCPDAVCREHYCKHVKGVQQLRKEGLLA